MKVVPPRGLTLIEVLVALAIVAVAMMAGIKASGALADNGERQILALLGQICSDNELISLRLQRRLPDVGVRTVACEQADQVLQMNVAVQATPNPGLRRVTVRVLEQQQVVFEVTGIVGGSSP